MAARRRSRLAANRPTSNDDDELRSELQRLGHTVGPITDTTRSIYVKKLNSLRAAERKKERPVARRKQVGTFFSSDESDSDSKRTKPSGRSTVSEPIQKRKSRATAQKDDIRTTLSRRSIKLENKRLTVTPPPTTKDRFSDTDDDEDEDEEDDSVAEVTNAATNTSWNSSPERSFHVPYRRPGTSRSDNSIPKSWYSTRQKETMNTTLEEKYSPGKHVSPSTKTYMYIKSGASTTNSREDKIPNDNEDVLQHEFATQEDTSGSFGSKYGHVISIGLVVLAIVFFLMLAIVYVTVGSLDDTTIADNLLLCSDKSTDTQSDCDNVARQKKVLGFANHLYDRLCTIAGNYECGESDVDKSNNMSRNAARQLALSHLTYVKFYVQNIWIKSRSGVSDDPSDESDSKPADKEVDVVLNHTLQMIIKNPEWGLRLYDLNGDVTNSSEAVEWLQSEHPHMTMLCRLWRSVSLVVFEMLLVLFVLLVIYGILVYVKNRSKKEEEEERKVYEMVEKIIDVLKTHHDVCKHDKDLPQYLAIPHVRDMLLPPPDRKKLQPLWNKAVEFLESSESRVRVESQCISGEDFAVWRWIQVLHDNYPKRKQWQGQAFENLEMAVRTPAYSPTPCLKIRNMFDPALEHGENWHLGIQDAILEKCHGNDGIVHIAVDKTSKEGCVYVKCSAPEAAGKAFKSLHGCWFDGKLVTVKFLRLDRYHQRFPTAMHATMPLKIGQNSTQQPSPSTVPTSNPETSDTLQRLYPSLEGLEN
ncbi:inner nuclear membrane protein Man1-like [Glandiceps talaboti]